MPPLPQPGWSDEHSTDEGHSSETFGHFFKILALSVTFLTLIFYFGWSGVYPNITGISLTAFYRGNVSVLNLFNIE